MKTRLTRIGLLMCTFLMVFGVSAFAAPKTLGQVVAQKYCKVYKTAESRNSNSYIMKGISADVKDINHGRYQISLGGKDCWIDQWNVEVPAALKTTIKAKKNNDIYASANIRAKKIGVLPKGTSRKALAYSDGFMKIKMNGKTGWVIIGGGTEDKVSLRMKVRPKASRQARGDIFNNFVKSFIGTKFSYGAAGPDAFDTSGFVYYCFSRLQPSVPRTISDQYANILEKMPREKASMYTVAFFDTDLNGTPDFAAVCISKDQAVGAINASTGVKMIDLNSAYYKKHFLACGAFLASDV